MARESKPERELPKPKTDDAGFPPNQQQPTGDYEHGHPGLPPADYQQPEENR